MQLATPKKPAAFGQKSNFDVLSLVLRAEPVAVGRPNDTIHFFRSSVGSRSASESRSNMPAEPVLLEFIEKNLKKQLAQTSIKSNFLNLYMIFTVKFSLIFHIFSSQNYFFSILKLKFTRVV